MNFIIYSSVYDENCGGAIALHKLCDLINHLGHTSSICLYKKSLWQRLCDNPWKNKCKSLLKIASIFGHYTPNSSFHTPIFRANKKNAEIIKQSIIIYPETVSGNPLGAKHIVRWLLHQPGYHTGKINYSSGELYFRYSSMIKPFSICGSKTSNLVMTIAHHPIEFYNKNNMAESRKGTAYCLRKGKGKEICHNLHDSILIDGKSHKDIAGIFKRVKRFYSYDTLTAYSRYATLCGCESVVIPDPGVNIDEWRPDITIRYGLSYGETDEQLQFAHDTTELALADIQNKMDASKEIARKAIQEMIQYFST